MLKGVSTAFALISASSILLSGGGLRDAHAGPPPAKAGPAKWTVMVYMNGKNDLEENAIKNYKQILKVGSTDDVNLVVELGLMSWPHVYRTRVTPAATLGVGGMSPAAGVVDLGRVDMGSRKSLSRFIAGAKRDYPASRYLLIIWDHGQGWRFDLVQGLAAGVKADSPVARDSLARLAATLRARPSNPRSISVDSEFHTRLYDSDIQEALESDPVDIIGFDACLMGMVETAHALRLGARWMIGSEECTPGDGWRYDDWCRTLTKHPDLRPRELCRVIGDSYLRAYTQPGPLSYDPDPTVTLSAVDLGRVRGGHLVGATSRLADRLIELVDEDGLDIVKAARAGSAEYCPDYLPRPGGSSHFQHIDLVRFCQQLAAQSRGKDPELERLAAAVVVEVRRAVAIRWCGKQRCDSDPTGERWGSSGLAIYFPASRRLLEMDKADPMIGPGYEIKNTDHPVEFVRDRGIHWASFVHFYVSKVPR